MFITKYPDSAKCIKIKGNLPTVPLQRSNHCFQFCIWTEFFFSFSIYTLFLAKSVYIYKFVIFQHWDYTLAILNFSLKIF